MTESRRPASWLDTIILSVDAGTPDASPSDVRSEHWDFFESDVLPLLRRVINERFDADVARFLISRFSNPDRFRASELLFCLLRDLGSLHRGSAALACASLELLQFARLITDDCLDRHTHRWGRPTLWQQQGLERALLVANEGVACAILLATRSGEGLVFHESEVDRQARVGQTVEAVAECWRRMSSGMWQELIFSATVIERSRYEEISAAKHANGWLCGSLFRGFLAPDEMRDEQFDLLMRGLVLSDLAAGAANDFSELEGYRGFGRVRDVYGEPRGDSSEIQLGRPTIFHVFAGSEDFLRGAGRYREKPGVLRDFRAVPAADLADRMDGLGGVDFAVNYRDMARRKASEAVGDVFLSSGVALTWTRAAISRSAVVHAPDDEPSVE